MLKKVREYIEKWHMLKSEDCVIAGVSGGADSICLVFMLLELQQKIGFRLVAVHVNHGLRGADADADEAYVKSFCAQHDIPCESYFADVELIAKNRKQSTEEAGREVRKEFFAQAMQKYGGTKIALAHHQNDSAETFLLNLARGTGIKGLGGIAPVNGNVIRPLLCVQRNEIEAYLKEKGVSYCTDQSNASDEYTRNRIRNHVLPYLEKEVNTKTIVHMNETMEQLRKVQEYLQEQVEQSWPECVREKVDGYVILQEAYDKLPDVLKPMLLKTVLVKICRREKDLESVHIETLQELFEKQTGRKVDLPYQMEARRIYEGVHVYKKCVSEEPIEEIHYDLKEEETVFYQAGKRIRCRVLEKEPGNWKTFEKNHTKQFDCDIIKSDICFRTRKQGDYITIHPDGQTQKLKSYFINEKIPQEERDKILLVAEGSHILWIVGYRQNCMYQVTANTKHILEIQIDEGESYGSEN